MKKLAYVGIDYHLDFLAIAVVIEGQKKIHETVRIGNPMLRSFGFIHDVRSSELRTDNEQCW
jgi:hypothetical protein